MLTGFLSSVNRSSISTSSRLPVRAGLGNVRGAALVLRALKSCSMSE